MEDFTEGSTPGHAPVSRYFRLPEDKRLEFKRRQKARYWQNADSIRKRCYLRVLDAGKINNGLTLIALHWLARHGDRLRSEWLAS